MISTTSTTPGTLLPRVHLASRSPRRRELLTAAGIEHEAVHPGLDDGELSPGKVSPAQWVMALAYLKASSAYRSGSAATSSPIIIGADTIVVRSDGSLIGQPVDEADARAMLQALRSASHDVYTGVALIDTTTGHREMFVDRAKVYVGAISDDEIERYLATGLWKGKAGAYNLAERIEAGWPIRFEGDPATVMGLPIRTLVPRLQAFRSS
jgi:septum formation protein